MFEKRLQAARQNTVEKEKQEFGKSCIRVQTIRRLWMFRLAAAACCVLTPPLSTPTEKQHGTERFFWYHPHFLITKPAKKYPL